MKKIWVHASYLDNTGTIPAWTDRCPGDRTPYGVSCCAVNVSDFNIH
jgi:hypothetical protein